MHRRKEEVRVEAAFVVAERAALSRKRNLDLRGVVEELRVADVLAEVDAELPGRVEEEVDVQPLRLGVPRQERSLGRLVLLRRLGASVDCTRIRVHPLRVVIETGLCPRVKFAAGGGPYVHDQVSAVSYGRD